MLQFNTTVHTITTRSAFRFLWRLNATLTTNASTVATAVAPNSAKVAKHVEEVKETSKVIYDGQCMAFNDLKRNLCNDLNVKSSVLAKIETAQNIHDILEIMKTPLLPQSDIMKALKVISEWVNENNNKESRIINDIRVAENIKKQKIKLKESNKINCFSKYNCLSTNEMVKEINKLTQSGKRNIYLLNYLFQNIIEYNEILSPGACSSLLFSMGNLCYSDERLLKKICTDVMKTEYPVSICSTIISMVKSMSFVRYRNEKFLTYVCNQVIDHKEKVSIKSITDLLLSLAVLGYYSANVNEIIQLYKPQLTIFNLEHSCWLNVIWAYTLMKNVSESDIKSVLNDEFILELFSINPKKKVSYQLKLLNINGYAQYALKNYSGPVLKSDLVSHDVVSKRSKQKESYISALQRTLEKMLPSTSHFQMNSPTGMGFLIDAEIYLDSEFKPIPIKESEQQKFVKIAILVLDYYDVCLGEPHQQGIINLYKHLLKCKNYEVFCISYQNFGVEDKIERHINYMTQLLQSRFNRTFQ